MYEALSTHTHTLYYGKTIAQLRERIEAELELTDLPPKYYSSWSNSRCITYLVQAGYITPYAGPEWFMALRPEGAPGESPRERPLKIRTQSEFINDNGSTSMGQTHITFWRNRNHVQLLSKNKENIYGEIFMTEESLRNLWIAIGKVIGFDENSLFSATRNLPTPQLHTPEIPPEKSIRNSENDFDIFEAINELNLDLDEEDEE